MRGAARAFASLLLITALVFPIEDAVAAGHRISLCNGIRNVAVVSLKVRDGTVTGFQRIPPLKCITVSVTTGDGKCATWALARIEDGSAASALINACGGKYAVIIRSQTGSGTSANLNIVPIK